MESFELQTKESFNYIKQNLDVNIDEIPMEYINYWIIKNPNSMFERGFEVDIDSHQFTVFLYAFMLSMSEKGKKKVEISEPILYTSYFIFQFLLSLRVVHDLTEFKIDRFQLFDFKNYKALSIQLFYNCQSFRQLNLTL